MAGNLPVPNGVECKLTWTFNGAAHALNVLHFRNSAGTAITQTIANTIDSSIKSAFTSSALGGQLSNGYALRDVSTRSMTANTDPWFIGVNAAVPATSVANPLPAATAFVVTLRTGSRGRSYNGRVYLAGWSEDANDAAGGATAAARTAALAFVDGIRVALVTGTPSLELGIVSRFTTPPTQTTPVERNPPIITAVTGIVAADLRWDTQRRRAIPGI